MRPRFVLSLILLLSLPLIPCAEESKTRHWWQMELVVSVTGESRYGNQRFGFFESYEVEIAGKVNFERDNGDYILFPGKQQIRCFTWQERVEQPGKPVQETDLSKKIKPAIIINYAVHRKGKLYIDFELSSITVPSIKSFQPQVVFLPRSAENRGVHPEDGYNRGLNKGSNQVVIAEDRIYQQALVEQEFNWRWSNKKGLWRDSHQVNLTVRIMRSTKEE